MRIISLLPSNTELACALGLADQVVGISHECDYPTEIKNRPVLTLSRLAPAAEPTPDLSDGQTRTEQIHEQVSKQLRTAHSLYQINQSLLESLHPNLILTQAKCEVCAVDYDEVESAVQKLPPPRPKILSFQPNSLEDLFHDLQVIAKETKREDQADRLIAQWRQRIEKIQKSVKSVPNRPRVLMVEWLKPLMAAGSWTPGLVHLAGGEQGLNPGPGKAKKITWEQVRQYNPEVIVLIPCGFSVARTLQDLPLLTSMEGWDKLSAVHSGKVFVVDGSQYFNRPGPRLIESLEILAVIIHPSFFSSPLFKQDVVSLF